MNRLSSGFFIYGLVSVEMPVALRFSINPSVLMTIREKDLKYHHIKGYIIQENQTSFMAP